MLDFFSFPPGAATDDGYSSCSPGGTFILLVRFVFSAAVLMYYNSEVWL